MCLSNAQLIPHAGTWRSLLHALRGSAPKSRVPCFYRPRLERLEDRLPPAAHDTLASAIPVPFDANQRAQVSDTLADPNQVNLYGLQLHAGDEVVADVTDQSLGNPASCLRIFNSAGQQLAVQANTGTLDTQQPFDASENGAYYVGVSSLGNLGYDPNTSASGLRR